REPAKQPVPELPPPRTLSNAPPASPGPAVNGSPMLAEPGHPLPSPGCPPATHECARGPLQAYIIEPPDVLLVESSQKLLPDQPRVAGQHLVRPDGTIGLGIYGSVYVAGMTLEQAQAAIAQQLARRVEDVEVKNISVDVLAYNSKVYYVITDGGGYGEQVYRLPITGNETVLDALSLVNGLPPVASKKHIWVARPCCAPYEGRQQVLPVDWIAITQNGIPTTNYQLLPGDRIYVKADCWISFDARVAKILAPFERMFGITLLGSETVNSIKGRTGGVP
ncbi:MAG TPA: polysaccharide biosynthesis/export family protein, partial [Gemmataceae bacterium]|nr:polysaccharide biosynthesis/export family protein [Gemmataceae bacterium]